MSHWYNQSFRKVHVLYVSPQWAKNQGENFDAVALADAYERAGVDCVQFYCKDHHGVVYYPCSLGLPYPRDIIGEIQSELSKRGIHFVAYVSICFDNYALGLHPEWRAVNDHGDPHKGGPFWYASVCSPYRKFVRTQIDELASRYQADGFWLDIIPLARDLPQKLWMVAPHPMPDYSHHAQLRYREVTGRGLPHTPTPEQEDEIFEFMTGEVDDFIAEMKSVIKGHQPDAFVTYNAAGAPGDPIDGADLISIEGHAPFYTRQSFIARWAKGREKPMEALIAGGVSRAPRGGGWNALDQKPVPVLRLEASLLVAQGGSPVFGQAPFADGGTDATQLEGFEAVFKPIEAAEPWLVDAKGVAEVGVVLAAKPRLASREWLDMQNGAEAFTQALIDEQILFDIIRLDQDISAYKCVVVAEQTALSEEEVQTLRHYAEAGGTLIVTGASGTRNEVGSLRETPALDKMCGFTRSGNFSSAYFYLKLDGELAKEVSPQPLAVDRAGAIIRPTTGNVTAHAMEPESLRTDATTVLWGDASPDNDLKYPAIVENAVGSGKSVYLAFTPDCEGFNNIWVKLLTRKLVRMNLHASMLTTDAPVGVEFTLNRQTGRLVLHLVNHRAGDIERLSIGAPAHKICNVAVTLDASAAGLDAVKAVNLVPGVALPFELANGKVSFVVPEIEIHTIVEIA
ncbi:beta-galactosidase trimerization domain-containing protein [Devosia algicola]|uniref:Beta-galactosidase trimerization domain-containing protein n=1 Tax=Devosia algicola TaxID=3026418 RepID=A0ABY7YL20_9HYPH|nr:alpha-amylase family protein [Devosia algicola]WDR01951.1 beta-galactosidase trimerization domain-containing protein [Devosia algicola]